MTTHYEENEQMQKQITTIPTTSELERIENWRKKRADIKCNFSFSTHKDETGAPLPSLTHVFDNKELDLSSKYVMTNATLCAATGSSSDEYARLLFSQVVSVLDQHVPNMEQNANTMLEALLAMKPADEYEGMLISRLLVLHQHSMIFMARAVTPGKSDQTIDLNINRSTKLMRLYNETLETLNKYRRRGEQKVTVTHNHVQVNEGGKAIVTSQLNHQPGGGDHDKK